MIADISVLLKSRASPEMLPCSLCNQKDLQIGTWRNPLYYETIDYLLWHRELVLAKDLSAPPFIGGWMGHRFGLDGCGKSQPKVIRSPDRPTRTDWVIQAQSIPRFSDVICRAQSQKSNRDSASASVLRYMLAWTNLQTLCQKKWNSGT